MDRDAVAAWVAGYERVWRSGGTDGLDGLFTADATYLRSPYDPAPLEGLDAIRGWWVDPAPFTMTARVVAADGSEAVVRVDVHYPDNAPREYRDLWVLTFAADGRVARFEEWRFAPEDAYPAPE